MRADLLLASALVGLVSGKAINIRAPADLAARDGKWHPKTTRPSFFNLKINVDCRKWGPPWFDNGHDTDSDDELGSGNLNKRQVLPDEGGEGVEGGDGTGDDDGEPSDDDGEPSNDDDLIPPPTLKPENCKLQGYGIRLEDGKVLATPYDEWWDPKVATFFVDDDTTMYTVSKHPLQMWINAQTGQFQYSEVGWLPAEAIALHFFHTGRSPYGWVGEHKASSFLTWPITQGITPEGQGNWLFCPDGTWDARTGQYQVFVDSENFRSSGIDKQSCIEAQLVAAEVNPWRKKPQNDDSDHEDDDDSEEEDYEDDDEGDVENGDGEGEYDEGEGDEWGDEYDYNE